MGCEQTNGLIAAKMDAVNLDDDLVDRPRHDAPRLPAAEDGPGSELERLRAELSTAQLRLARIQESSRELMSSILHELRAPITLIQGYVEAMLDGVITDPDKQRRSLETIYAKVTGMNRLVADLFQLAALEAGQVRFELRPVNVRSLENHLKSQYELDVEQAGYGLLVTAGDICNEDLVVKADLHRLDQVFTNLFTNAFRYLPKEGGLIEVCLELAENGLLVRVKDNGEGIDESDLPFIFERFYRGKAPCKELNRYQSGIGLGLSICQEIIASHNGSISVQSKPGQGTEFRFVIPFAT